MKMEGGTWMILSGIFGAFGLACCILFAMYSSAARENTELKAALASQSALLAETQKELQLRDTVIRKRDAEIAEAERKAEAQGRKYARLLREKKDVREWADSPLPADVRGLLNANADGAARPAGRSDDGSCDP